MSTIGLAPIRMSEATLSIAADDYSISVNQILFTPTPEVKWVSALGSRRQTPLLVGARWNLSIGFAQDFTTPGSLSTYLLEHAGQQKTVTLEVPGRVVAATILVLPAQLGGVANQIPASVATLPLYGAPSLGLAA